jgi:hypothetical protein
VTEKLTSNKARADEAAASLARPRAGQLVMFPTAKKPRGRPKKLPATPSQDDFDIVCLAIRGITKGAQLARAKAEARRRVSSDERIKCNAAAIVLFSRFLDAINHKEGRDWHSVAWYASKDNCDRHHRVIERAYKALVDAGHLLRRRKSRGRGWDISETTSPTLARAANALPQEPEGSADKGTVRKFYRYRQINLRVPARKAKGTGKQFAGSRHENTQGTGTGAGLTSKTNFYENLQENLVGNVSARNRAADDVLNFEVQEAAQSAAGAIPSESTQGQAPPARDRAAGAGVRVGERPAEGDPTPGRALPGTLSLDPRFDQTLPLRQRLRLIGKYRKPANEAEVDTLAEMRRAAKGWSLEWCLDQYVGYAAEKANFEQPRDAHAAFLGYLRKKITKPASGWVDLAMGAGGSKKNSKRPPLLWAGTAEFDAELSQLYRDDPKEAARAEGRGWVRAMSRRPTATAGQIAVRVLQRLQRGSNDA